MSTPDDHYRHRPPQPLDPAEQKSYAMSGKIMLSAIIVLFAVVVFMLILHLYARWYLLRSRRRHRHRRRRTHLVFYVEPPNPSNPLFSSHHQGLDPLLLKSLPTFTFANKSSSEDVLECAVCLSEFEDGESGRRLPKCEHSFHVDCIDMWFHSHSTCPLCRAPVESAFLDSPAEEIGVDVPWTESTGDVALTESTFLGPSSSASFGGMGKGFDIEVPVRSASFSFGNNSNSEESGPGSGFIKSPRLLALKRMLSREKRPVLSPAGSETGELGDIEEARGPHGGF